MDDLNDLMDAIKAGVGQASSWYVSPLTMESLDATLKSVTFKDN